MLMRHVAVTNLISRSEESRIAAPESLRQIDHISEISASEIYSLQSSLFFPVYSDRSFAAVVVCVPRLSAIENSRNAP